MLRHFSNYVVGRGQRVEGTHQVLQVAVAPDPPEARPYRPFLSSLPVRSHFRGPAGHAPLPALPSSVRTVRLFPRPRGTSRKPPAG